MKRVFADTAYFVALVRERDQLHRQATKFRKHPPGQLLTTEWEYGIDTALTSDEDFEQAGFTRLMDPGPQGVREPVAPPYATGSRDPVVACNMAG